MCKELDEAKQKVTQMEHVVRTAERNLDMSCLDQSELSASLAGNVGRLDKLIGQAKLMRQHRADLQVDIIAGGGDKSIGCRFPAHCMLHCPFFFF
jgi:hypothetical protein